MENVDKFTCSKKEVKGTKETISGTEDEIRKLEIKEISKLLVNI